MKNFPRKTAILTYHRVRERDAAREFYDVSIDRFLDQLSVLSSHLQSSDAVRVGVAITFDDGTADHRRVAEELAVRRLSGIFFPVVERIGTAGYLTRADIRQLVALGHIVGSHTLSHRKLPLLSERELAQELSASREYLEQLTGRAVEWFAPPGGYLDDRSFTAALACGYRFVRTMDWGYAPPLEGRLDEPLRSIPVLPTVSRRRLKRVLGGEATFFGFRVKQAMKRLVGDNIYIGMRDRLLPLRHYVRR